ncbi:MAG: hypothetical protein M5U13_00905 [Thermoanaerobaculia bacterium]|nr:hypothetical protein [Thermoanaerobaculia bacterium]
MLLRVAAEHLHAQVSEKSAFDQLVEAVVKAAPVPLTHRTALNQLNKARVAFKHFGLEPKPEDVAKLLADMDSFFPETVQSILGADLAELSLRSLVGHRRTENWLAKAEQALAAGDFDASINASAVAFAVIRHHCAGTHDFSRLDPSGRFREGELRAVLEAVEQKFKALEADLDLFALGVDPAEYRRFRRYTPRARLTMAATVILQRGMSETPVVGADEAAFCARFTLDAALAMQSNILPPRWPIPRPDKAVRVVRECDLVVWPGEGAEVIRQVSVGEQLAVFSGGRQLDGHIQVVESGDGAFVPADAVEEFGSAGA